MKFGNRGAMGALCQLFVLFAMVGVLAFGASPARAQGGPPPPGEDWCKLTDYGFSESIILPTSSDDSTSISYNALPDTPEYDCDGLLSECSLNTDINVTVNSWKDSGGTVHTITPVSQRFSTSDDVWYSNLLSYTVVLTDQPVPVSATTESGCYAFVASTLSSHAWVSASVSFDLEAYEFNMDYETTSNWCDLVQFGDQIIFK